ncbi:MAG: hypothetical protein FWD95_01840 [Nocardioidaceae bacterium]|nr:hypothetical protein [Nocardioidaceae bacterium]
MADATDTTSTTDSATAAQTSGDTGTSTATDATATAGSASGTQQTDQPTGLGDAGKRAIDAMKAERNEAKEALKALRTEFDALKAQIDGKEAEHAATLEAQKVKDEALALANKRIVSAELRAAAKGKVNEAALGDLAFHIDPSDFEVGSDGSVDSDAIVSAIDSLINTKPYLAAQGQQVGSADAGARNGTGPKQLTREDIAQMSPEEIVAAKNDGRLKRLLGG